MVLESIQLSLEMSASSLASWLVIPSAIARLEAFVSQKCNGVCMEAAALKGEPKLRRTLDKWNEWNNISSN
jgi:hypothetical protein